MTAGCGVRHSEFNRSITEPLRFIQTWILPRTRGLQPRYGSLRSKDAPQNKGQWAHLVSDVQDKNVQRGVKVNQDINLFTTVLSSGSALEFKLTQNRQAYIVCIDGSVALAAGGTIEQLESGDAADAQGPAGLEFSAVGEHVAHIMVWEMQLTGGS